MRYTINNRRYKLPKSLGVDFRFEPDDAVPAQIQLYWVDSGADHYNIYRALANNGPYTEIAQGVKKTATGLVYIDNSVSNRTTYYYRIAPATLNDTETCQSNQTFPVTVGGR